MVEARLEPGTVHELDAALVYCTLWETTEHGVLVEGCGSCSTTVGVGGVVYSFGTSVLAIISFAAGALTFSWYSDGSDLPSLTV